MSSLSSNDNNDSMARATYYAQQQLLAQQHQIAQQQQIQYQQAQLHMQYQQQKALLNKNQQHHNPISNTSNTHPTYNINNTYTATSCVNNYSQIANNNNQLPPQHINSHNNLPATLAHHPNNSHQQYQHPSLSTVFPSIYAETNFNKSNNNGNNSKQLNIFFKDKRKV